MLAKAGLLAIALIPRIRGLRPGEAREELLAGEPASGSG
jgi:hypothetical protein